jgi:hypothetical protein
MTGGWGGISEPDEVTAHSVVLFLPDGCSYNSRRVSVELRISLIAFIFSSFFTQMQNVAPFSYIFFYIAAVVQQTFDEGWAPGF